MLRRWLAGQYARPSGWLGRFLIGPHLDRLSRDMNLVAAERLDARPGERVLEVGFGGGDLLELVLGKGAETTGADISDAMIRRARRRFAGDIENGRLRLIEASATNLPLADASQDKAVSVNVLYFWDDPEAVMAELARVIRPGGRLLLCFQTPEQVKAWPGHRHGFRAYDGEDVAAWMRGGGFGAIQACEARDRALGAYLCLSAIRGAA